VQGLVRPGNLAGDQGVPRPPELRDRIEAVQAQLAAAEDAAENTSVRLVNLQSINGQVQRLHALRMLSQSRITPGDQEHRSFGTFIQQLIRKRLGICGLESQ
jgi:hypothetical protein